MKVYGDRGSGNCHKVVWTADAIGRPYTWIDVDIMKGESRTPAYLAKFPQGQVPAVEFDDGRCLAQSNAIIRYLARGSRLLPEDAFTQAKIDEWLFWEQYSHEPYVATTRYHVVYLKRTLGEREAWRVERGEKALDFLNARLSGASDTPAARRPDAPSKFLVGDSLTIADIALLAYTRLAPEGGFDLATRPNVRAWIARVEQTLGLSGKGSGS
jgi:glutathione S-transferase